MLKELLQLYEGENKSTFMSRLCYVMLVVLSWYMFYNYVVKLYLILPQQIWSKSACGSFLHSAFNYFYLWEDKENFAENSHMICCLQLQGWIQFANRDKI